MSHSIAFRGRLFCNKPSDASFLPQHVILQIHPLELIVVNHVTAVQWLRCGSKANGEDEVPLSSGTDVDKLRFCLSLFGVMVDSIFKHTPRSRVLQMICFIKSADFCASPAVLSVSRGEISPSQTELALR